MTVEKVFLDIKASVMNEQKGAEVVPESFILSVMLEKIFMFGLLKHVLYLNV